jgi:hypothetical protein
MERAQQMARDKLVDKLCAQARGCCAALGGRVDGWKTGAGDQKVCAMAVVKTADLRAWRKECTSITGLADKLLVAARELLDQSGAQKRRAAVGKILDQGVHGGERAEWLRDQMIAALGKAGANVMDVPASWDGKALPKGVDLLISGRATTRREEQRAVVDLVWKARFKRGRAVEMVAAAPVVFPAAAAPAGGASFSDLPPNRGDLFVRVEAPNAGSLCPGQETSLGLYSDKARYVRVFDLYGEGDALLLYPNDGSDGRVPAGSMVSLGRFKAVPAQGSDTERFLLVAADDPMDLGRMAKYKTVCRVPADIARALHAGKGIPAGTVAASDGFRIVASPDCPDAPPGGASDLSQLPVCE